MLKSIVRRVCEPAHDLPVPPLLQRIYAARNLHSPHELQRELRLLTSPSALLNMEHAVDLLYAALRERWRILIIADFDADGATSCALAVRALRAMGASRRERRSPMLAGISTGSGSGGRNRHRGAASHERIEQPA